jgi:5-methyltetrahydropteroyltriglutamate--homocysteine methyltransferase
VVWLQETLGLRSVTDGEFRRSGPAHFFEHLEGLTPTGAAGKVRWNAPVCADEFSFLRAITRQTPKIALPSPVGSHFAGGRARISRDAYPDLDGFWTDIVRAFRQELGALHAAGCRYAQINDAAIARLGETATQARLAERGDDWRDLLGLYAEVLNAVIEEVPRDMHIALHVRCGESGPEPRAYEAVADVLFNRIRVNSYFLQYPVGADFSALRLVPRDKPVVLGLLATGTAEPESVERLVEQMLEAGRFMPLQRLGLSPRSGFSELAGAPAMSAEQQNAKLRRMIEVAKTVWGET